MKKVTSILVLLVFALLSSTSAFSQVYKGSVGLGIDLHDGATLVGPSGKYFFDQNNAVQAEIGFGDDITKIEGLYQYHGQFTEAEGLQWFAGAGPAIFMYDGGSDFWIRFTGGLEYKIPSVPLVFSFDWRPGLSLESDVDDRFEAGIFGLGFRYAFD
ncbi:MAG: hypothetical protein ACK5NB_03320 [Flavobacteriaceae bacterium]